MFGMPGRVKSCQQQRDVPLNFFERFVPALAYINRQIEVTPGLVLPKILINNPTLWSTIFRECGKLYRPASSTLMSCMQRVMGVFICTPTIPSHACWVTVH